MAQGNPIVNKLMEYMGKKPKERSVADIADEDGYADDPIAHGHERGYEPGWKSFSRDPQSPKIQIRRSRGRKAKHPV